MNKISELKKALKEAEEELSAAKEQDEIDFAKEEIADLEKQIKEEEGRIAKLEKPEAKPEKEDKPEPKKEDKKTLKDGSVLLKKSDTEYMLQYHGEADKTSHFEYNGTHWVIDCCEAKKEYPKFKAKGDIMKAVNFVIKTLDKKGKAPAKKEPKAKTGAKKGRKPSAEKKPKTVKEPKAPQSTSKEPKATVKATVSPNNYSKEVKDTLEREHFEVLIKKVGNKKVTVKKVRTPAAIAKEKIKSAFITVTKKVNSEEEKEKFKEPIKIVDQIEGLMIELLNSIRVAFNKGDIATLKKVLKALS